VYISYYHEIVHKVHIKVLKSIIVHLLHVFRIATSMSVAGKSLAERPKYHV